MSLNTQWRQERVRRLPMVLLALTLMAGTGYAGYRFGQHRAEKPQQALQPPPLAGGARPTATTRASAGHSFVNDSFRIKILDVTLHRKQLAARNGHPAFRPANGQFVIVRLVATNVSNRPAIMSATASQLVDSAGRTYDAGVYLAAAGQGLDRFQQPGTSARGWIAFDVPSNVRAVSAVIVQPDEDLATSNLATTVSLNS